MRTALKASETAGKSKTESHGYVFGCREDTDQHPAPPDAATGPEIAKRGWLKNGNQPGDPNSAPRCGAKNRRGNPCRCPAMKNGRCRLHGGLSTGAKTPEGIERIRRARWKHGRYSAAAKAERKQCRELLRECRATLAEVEQAG